MRAGGRETIIQILEAIDVEDPRYGNVKSTWEVERDCWAGYINRKGREFYDAGSLVTQNSVAFELDWMDGQGITPDNRIRCNGVDFNIKSIDEDLDLKRRIIIEAVSGLNETQK